MDISDIAREEYRETAPDTELGTLRSTLETNEVDGVLVVDEDGVGVVTPRDLVRSHLSDDTKAGTVAKPVPSLQRTADVRETARLLVENQITVAPVFEGETLWGSVTRDALLAAVLDNLDVLTVGDVQTQEVVTVARDATMGEVINELRDNDVSRLPVVDSDGHLAGIVTTSDVVEFVVRDAQTATGGDRGGEKLRLLDLPVYDVMSEPAETTTPETSVAEAVETMLQKGYDGLVVSPEYSELVAGILTKTDVLRALTVAEEEVIDVQIVNVDLLRTTTRAEVAERIEEVARKHQEMDVLQAQVRFQKHDEDLRGKSLVRCVTRLWTDEEQMAGTGEGYGADNALSVSLEKLERNVIDHKRQRSDEEYRGQLLRKLNDL